MEYRVNKDYPEVNVEETNVYYAKLLLNDYSGINSELTAITQYVYQGFYLFKDYSKISKTLEKIAIVEMRHLELLGKTIKLLGVKPEFKFNNNNDYYYQYWNSSYVDYNTHLISMLKDNILKEQVAIRNYEQHISVINDKYIKVLLERIIEDEKVHIKCFKELLQEVNNLF